MCQYVVDLHNSLNQYFPNDQGIKLHNHAWVKCIFKMQYRPIDFNVTTYTEFIGMISDSMLH